ncbi:semaphorin-1A-like [Arctopsyche grandis]|uniref:semaphorin-1A-like n=1 Tax=Arctopsyche grandis TaxID=121162 RepID=UPI00406D6585
MAQLLPYMYASCLIAAHLLLVTVVAWNPDPNPKHYFKYEELISTQFGGHSNASYKNFFKLLNHDESSILIGGRNTLYNLSLYDIKENHRIEWSPTIAHRELCALKGRSQNVDCHNYIRIAVSTGPGRILICGTNAYKPICRHYHLNLSDSRMHSSHFEDFEAQGLCPYDPEHNSTAILTERKLYAATVADFSGTDSIIYRKPQRTERYDLRQLNNPNFVSSFRFGNYVFFFYRETAVEYMNCGKSIYSRVARVCINDKGGPYQYADRWTSFLKARLNCSIQGEYPFYFDEIQSTTDIISGVYGSDEMYNDILYGVFTTPVNSIGGSAVCAFSMRDVLSAFSGSFKAQETINSNWLPVESAKVPTPRPGECMDDSRTLPESSVNFVKTHPLMEQAVPNFFSKPLLIRVSLQYRFTAIAVHPQVQAMTGRKYDVIYVGTDDGRVIKALNAASAMGNYDIIDGTSQAPVETVIVSETQVLKPGTPVKQLHVAIATEKLIVVSYEKIISISLHTCKNLSCSQCISLQDPHCAWDTKNEVCAWVGNRQLPNPDKFLQDIEKGSIDVCNKVPQIPRDLPGRTVTHGTLDRTAKHPVQDLDKNNIEETDNNIVINLVPPNDGDETNSNTAKEKHETDSLKIKRDENTIYTAQALHITVVASCMVTLLLGFVIGYLFSRRFRHPFFSETTPFHEQHNHLNRLTPSETPLNANPSAYLPPRANKTINLVVNVPIKQDNLQHELGSKDRTHECKNSNESLDKDIKCGTLQKVKKTYI